VFPPADRKDVWKSWNPKNQKQSTGDAQGIEAVDPTLHGILYALNSSPVIRFLEQLTGIPGLLPDPHFTGGGLHQVSPGGRLPVHADFNYMPEVGLYRRLNLLIFLNKDWKDEYGGHLELWDAEMHACVTRILPVFNRCVIFATLATSFHGHPEPLACPPGNTRKAIALYYYTRENGEEGVPPHGVLWQTD
jgi:Rps23 Pro-64 3,4-dihydroxylase Tpa1-like proline 4-hydroxylase